MRRVVWIARGAWFEKGELCGYRLSGKECTCLAQKLDNCGFFSRKGFGRQFAPGMGGNALHMKDVFDPHQRAKEERQIDAVGKAFAQEIDFAAQPPQAA